MTGTCFEALHQTGAAEASPSVDRSFWDASSYPLIKVNSLFISQGYENMLSGKQTN